MIHLAIGQLRRRGWRYLSLFFAVFAAVALSVGTAAIVESMQATVNGMFDKPYKGVGTVAQVRSSEPIDEVLAGIPVEYAFDQQFSASIKRDGSLYDSTTVRSLADGPLQWRTIAEGTLPHGPREVVVVDDTPLGTSMELKVPGSPELQQVTVVGRVEQSAQEQLMGAGGLLADALAVRQWAGNAAIGELRVDSVSSDQLKMLLKDAVSDVVPAPVHTAKLSGQYLSGRDNYFLLLTAFMIIVAVVAMLVIFSSYSVIAAERQREYALLRAIGASSGQLQGSALIESLLLGSFAGLLGIPAGLKAASWAGEHADQLGVRFELSNVTLRGEWMLAALACAILVCIASALPAARSSVHRPLVQSLSANSPQASRWGLIGALVVGMVSLTVGAFGWSEVPGIPTRRALVLAIGASGAIVLGAICIAAVFLPWVTFRLSPIFARVPTLHLANALVGRQRLRSGSLVAIVLAGVALISAVFSGQQRIGEYLELKAYQKGAVDIVVQPVDGSARSQLLDALNNAPHVEAVTKPPLAQISIGELTDAALGLSVEGGRGIVRGQITGAGPGEVVLGQNSILRASVKSGALVTMKVQGEPHQLRVVLSDSFENYIDPALLEQHTERLSAPKQLILAKIDDQTARDLSDTQLNALRSAAGSTDQEVIFKEAFTAREKIADTADRIYTLTLLLSSIALLIAGIGISNTVVLMVRERVRDFAILSAVGISSSGRRAIVMVELVSLLLPVTIFAAPIGWMLGFHIVEVLIAS
ncbi:macrolide transporter ATP-binding /permease protein [Corynebacterium kalinowskii]|uniref:Macrolide transporter ATP-binding /permease protein n=1 Tax=Corynebacterium kalinowskii TaxID=2675216 RepID=A0A6B8VZM7_9CORY|nr:FtsX-like permease family protein [Corynebacterium kalinowskii]QGU01008.1 macrolide transporter ATP-binding /permease protein [Corynebacterium kalinowskii]